VGRMGVVLRDHPEGLALLLQEKFRGSVPWVATLGEDKVLDSGRGTAGVKGMALAPVAAIAPPMRIANLPAMPFKNTFLSFCIRVPSIREILIV
jgi:hypothetical protein